VVIHVRQVQHLHRSPDRYIREHQIFTVNIEPKAPLRQAGSFLADYCELGCLQLNQSAPLLTTHVK
jgi:hypothetical protein